MCLPTVLAELRWWHNSSGKTCRHNKIWRYLEVLVQHVCSLFLFHLHVSECGVCEGGTSALWTTKLTWTLLKSLVLPVLWKLLLDWTKAKPDLLSWTPPRADLDKHKSNKSIRGRMYIFVDNKLATNYTFTRKCASPIMNWFLRVLTMQSCTIILGDFNNCALTDHLPSRDVMRTNTCDTFRVISSI